MFQILSIIVNLLITLLVFLIPIFIIVGIILAIVAKKENDQTKKVKMKKWMKWSFIGPILTLILVLVFWGLVNIVVHTVTG